MKTDHRYRSAFQGLGLGLLGASVIALYALVLIPGGDIPEGEAVSEPRTVSTAPAAAPEPGARLSAEERAGITGRTQARPHAARAAGLTLNGLESRFARLGYKLAPVAEGRSEVPRVFLSALPDDLPDLDNVDQRKRVFLRAVLPLVLQANEQIIADRERLLEIEARLKDGGPLRARDRAWLERLAERYRLDEPDVDALLLRVDVVPPSLALAQAAEESGWGTSRFAQEGNALFGQWVFGDSPNGIVPAKREEGADYRVRAFDELLEAVRAYKLNLNTHNAYAEFRTRRARMRAEGRDLDPYALAATLTRYSARGTDYVDSLHVIMRVNDLPLLDGARLETQFAGLLGRD